jgi:VWFA-related protein
MKIATLVALGVVLQFSLLAAAQQPGGSPQPTPTPPVVPQSSPSPPQAAAPGDDDVVRITTNLVQVDAVVTDKNGKPVTDLRADEVQIFEDGKQRTITHFSYVLADSGSPSSAPTKPSGKTNPNSPPGPPLILRPDQVRRTIALVVDDLGLSFESTYYVRQALKKFVDELMQPGDLVAIVRTSGGMGALQQFTSDKRQLYAAIEKVKWNNAGRSGIGAFPALQPLAIGMMGPEIDAANREADQFRTDVYAVGTLGAVGYVIDGLRELPGRKSILLISDGFAITSRIDPGIQLRAAEALRGLVERASRASVVVYTMNATGLQTLSLTAADDAGGRTPDQLLQAMASRRNAAFDSQEGLDSLAQQTGGLAIHNTNDLGRGIKKIMEDQKGYYLIGYRPDESSFDAKTGRVKFHKLTIKITRPGKFAFRTRSGFYGVPDEGIAAAVTTPQQQILKALTSPFGAAGVHVHLTSLFANDPKAGSLMRSMLHVDADDLTFTDEPGGWHQAAFDVVALTFGDNGIVAAAPTNRTYTLRVNDDNYLRMRKDGFVYYLTVLVKKPGAYQLRAAVRDHGSGRVGSASQFVEVPDLKKNRLTLSGLVVTTTEAQATKVSGSQAAGGQPTSEPASEEAQTTNSRHSAAVRQFRNGETLEYGVVVYNAHVDKSHPEPQLQMQVKLYRNGDPIFTGAEQQFKVSGTSDLKRVAAAGGIQLAKEMVPGEYVIQIIVKDLLADEKHGLATQWIDFEVVK